MDQPYGSSSPGRSPRGAWEGWAGERCGGAGRVDRGGRTGGGAAPEEAAGGVPLQKQKASRWPSREVTAPPSEAAAAPVGARNGTGSRLRHPAPYQTGPHGIHSLAQGIVFLACSRPGER